MEVICSTPHSQYLSQMDSPMNMNMRRLSLKLITSPLKRTSRQKQPSLMLTPTATIPSSPTASDSSDTISPSSRHAISPRDTQERSAENKLMPFPSTLVVRWRLALTSKSLYPCAREKSKRKVKDDPAWADMLVKYEEHREIARKWLENHNTKDTHSQTVSDKPERKIILANYQRFPKVSRKRSADDVELDVSSCSTKRNRAEESAT